MSDAQNNQRDHACLEHAPAADLDRYLRFLRLYDAPPAEADNDRAGVPLTSGPAAIGEAAALLAADDESAVHDLFFRLLLCQCALLQAMGWADEPSAEGGEVVRGYHVRDARHLGGCLILREADPDGVVFITGVAVPDGGYVGLEGWIRARDGKRDEWRRDLGDEHGAVFFVPRSALRPMETLPHDPKPLPPRPRIIVSVVAARAEDVADADAWGVI
jgi:hypothetical protein